MKLLAKSAMLVLSLALTAFVMNACFDKEPKDVAISFVESLYKGNADKMISLLHIKDEEMKQVGVKEMVVGKLNAMAKEAESRAKAAGGLKNIEVISQNITEDRAQVELRVHFGDGSGRSESISLIKDEDKWRVKL